MHNRYNKRSAPPVIDVIYLYRTMPCREITAHAAKAFIAPVYKKWGMRKDAYEPVVA